MTKTIVIGQTKNKNEKYPIVFTKLFTRSHVVDITTNKPKDYKFIELICLDYDGHGSDLMFAYNKPDNRDWGLLYLGRWNDGVV